jgi:hypothetical protein
MAFKFVLHLAEETAVGNGSAVADGDEHPNGQLVDWVFALDATKNAGTQLDVKIQDSFDGGTVWFDVPLAANPQLDAGGDFTPLTGDGQEVLCPIRPMGPLIRALRTSTGDGWDYTLKGSCDQTR